MKHVACDHGGILSSRPLCGDGMAIMAQLPKDLKELWAEAQAEV